MPKSPQAFRTIREVADWLDVAAHVLRFWESKFPQIKPVKRAGGRRYYRPGDMELVGGIKVLLHDQGMTIKGVQNMLSSDGVGSITALAPPLGDLDAPDEPQDELAQWDDELNGEPPAPVEEAEIVPDAPPPPLSDAEIAAMAQDGAKETEAETPAAEPTPATRPNPMPVAMAELAEMPRRIAQIGPSRRGDLAPALDRLSALQARLAAAGR